MILNIAKILALLWAIYANLSDGELGMISGSSKSLSGQSPEWYPLKQNELDCQLFKRKSFTTSLFNVQKLNHSFFLL